MKYISILGSTGSIGSQALEIIRAQKDLRVASLSAYSNIDLIEKQILEFSPKLVCIYDEKKCLELKKRLPSQLLKKTELVFGMEGLLKSACMDEAQIVLTAVVGMVGIRPTMAAIKAGKDIALANKETLVCAGELIIKAAKKAGVKIYPVDSEHSAIFQSLNGERREDAQSIILTASGGPFRGKSREELKNVTVSQALDHPNWKMGRKVTIDSATLANKGLEVMEARWLFDMPQEKIQVVIHPQSVLHSAVEYKDGAVIGQLGSADMKIPIQYAFLYPERRPVEGKKLDFYEMSALTFERPDLKTFKALDLALRALKTGGTMPCVFNAADEAAVGLFLKGSIGFLDIADLIEKEMNRHNLIEDPTLDQIIEVGEEIIERYK